MICTHTYHEITEKSAFVLVELLLVQYHLVTKTYDFLCEYECLGEVMVVIDPMFARMHMV